MMASAMVRDGQAAVSRYPAPSISPTRQSPKTCSSSSAIRRSPRGVDRFTPTGDERHCGQCEQAAAILGVKALRDATVEMLEAKGTRWMRSFTVALVTSSGRRPLGGFPASPGAGDRTEIGRLMRASHESLRDDYEVSCRELDLMAEAAWAAPGCVGARMTGAGFGGACVALVSREQLTEFQNVVENEYRRATGLAGTLLACSPSRGCPSIFWGAKRPSFAVADTVRNCGSRRKRRAGIIAGRTFGRSERLTIILPSPDARKGTRQAIIVGEHGEPHRAEATIVCREFCGGISKISDRVE